MARKPMVTRTVQTTLATVLCLNTETAEPFNQTVTLSGTFKDNKAVMKAVKALIENDTISVAKVVDVEIEEKLYGMPEQDFINAAKVLPPRGTKVIE